MFIRFNYARLACLCIFSLFYSGALLADLVNIDNVELKKLLNEKTIIIDVRRADEWTDSGVIENSQLLTFFDSSGGYDAEKWYADLSKISDTATPVILICRTGMRSKVVGNWLVKSMGYQNVYNVKDGILGWKGAAGETVPPY